MDSRGLSTGLSRFPTTKYTAILYTWPGVSDVSSIVYVLPISVTSSLAPEGVTSVTKVLTTVSAGISADIVAVIEFTSVA